ncbi:MAG: ABC transporter substrate-binding protein [Candidatus Riflebacteria bacterium]|nr:ABC transporter substrate-binding protein [Candidatus Riflebacteria bacterium]
MILKHYYFRFVNFLKGFDVYQLLALPVLLVVLLASTEFKNTDIKIGVILPLSGANALRATSHCNGLRLALKHINAQGGVNGRKLRLEIIDNQGSPDLSAEIVRDLIYETNVVSLIGGISPAATRVIQNMAEKAQVPFLTALCTHFEVTDCGSRFTFRSITDDKRQSEALAEFSARRFKSRKPALIYDSNLYGADSAQKYIETSIKFGQQVCAAVSYRPGSLNFRRQLQVIFASNPDSMIILTSPEDAAVITRHAREARFSHPILGGNQLASPEFTNLAGVYSESVITTLPFNARLGGQRADYFLSEYFDTYAQQADSDSALGYEALMLNILALRAGEVSRLSVRNSLAQLHGWESVAGSGGFDNSGNQVRPAEIAIIKERQKIPVNLEALF